MKKEDWEVWVFLGLLGLLAYQAGNVIQEATVNIAGSIVDKFSNAVAAAEGFFVSNSRPARNHNPGDLETDVTGKAIGKDGAYIVYSSDADGWDALKFLVGKMFSGTSHIYTPQMSISEVAYHYADGANDPAGAANWAANVAGALGVDVSTRLSDLTA